MDAEKRKAYNKEYYNKNRVQILDKALKKVECEFCKKSVISYNILKHQQTSICKRREELLKTQAQRRNKHIKPEEQKPEVENTDDKKEVQEAQEVQEIQEVANKLTHTMNNLKVFLTINKMLEEIIEKNKQELPNEKDE
jgi:hypothetical protein